MRKSKEEIVKQTGELIDLVGELFDEREETWRKFCKCSRDLKEVEQKLAEANFRIEKALNYIAVVNEVKGTEAYRIGLIEILEGKNE